MISDRFATGVDLGSQHDYTAICVAQIVKTGDGKQRELELIIRHIDRFRNRLYPEVAQDVYDLTNRYPLAGKNDLIIDATGVGPAVTDIYRKRRIKHRPVIIHGGERETHEKGYYRIPKLNLVQALLVLFHHKRIHIVPSLRLADTLGTELRNFRRVQNENTGHQVFSHREGEHDDLVLAAALAAWGAQRFGGGSPSRAPKGDTGPFGADDLPFTASPEVLDRGLDWAI